MILDVNPLIANIDKLHTTELGIVRVRRNIELQTNDVVQWCKKIILNKNCKITRKGKNWYASIDSVIITINSHNYSIITAHKM